MRTEDLLDAIGNVDDDLLERSEKVRIKKRVSWKAWVPLAACVCLIAGVSIWGLPRDFGLGAKDECAADSATMEDIEGNVMGGTSEEITDKDFPLEEKPAQDESELHDASGEATHRYTFFAAEESYDVDVVRHITFILSANNFEMMDRYTIFNNTSEDIVMNLYHPSKGEFEKKVPGNGEIEIEVVQNASGSCRFVVASDEHIAYRGITAELLVEGNVTILDETFGFDFENGKTKVELDSTKEYYLEVE